MSRKREVAKLKCESYEKLAKRVDDMLDAAWSIKFRSRYRNLNNPESEAEGGLVPLEKPYIMGFERSFVVRQEIVGTKLGKAARKALELVQWTVSVKRKSDLDKWDRVNGPQRPKVVERDKFVLLDPAVMDLFRGTILKGRTRAGVEWERLVFEIKNPGALYRLKTKAVWATHMRVPPSEAESLSTKLEAKYLESGFMYKWNTKRHRYRWNDRGYDRSKEQRTWKRLEKAAEQDDRVEHLFWREEAALDRVNREGMEWLEERLERFREDAHLFWEEYLRTLERVEQLPVKLPYARVRDSIECACEGDETCMWCNYGGAKKFYGRS